MAPRTRDSRLTRAATRRTETSLVTSEFYLISSAADLLDMHPQTLRKYERLGLVQPLRTLGSMRVYRRDELDRLRLIKSLVDEAGINLAGIRRLLSIAEVVERLRPLLAGDDVHERVAAEFDEIVRILGLEPLRRP